LPTPSANLAEVSGQAEVQGAKLEEVGVAGEAAAPAIHTEGLGKVYGHVVALAGLTMSVPRGEVFGFLGPNGAGKTTAIKLLLGLTRPSTGEALVLGSPAGDRDTRRRVGYLPELFRYQAWLTAREVLVLHCRLARLGREAWPREIADAVQLVGLEGREDDRVGTFSKGMTQRLGLAVALLGKPDLVMLDEPTSALDPVGRRDVRDIIHHLKAMGITVFLNSHLLGEVEQVCDRVAVVDHGRVVATGRLEDLLGGSATRVRVSGLGEQERRSLGRFGDVENEGEWLAVKGIETEAVPDLVAEMVRLGGRVYAVEPRHQSLE
jgi:ABC-2 type transport system ATP-binding protein